MRHHVQVPLSQEPTSEALVRLARRKDDSISELRRGQLEVINVIFGNRDCLALMPTGGGKSCYQWARRPVLELLDGFGC
jgi:superfamily II DNA helicase RecQ